MRRRLLTVTLAILVVLATFPLGIFAEATDDINTPDTNENYQTEETEPDNMTIAEDGTVDSLSVSSVYDPVSQKWNAVLTWTGTANAYNAWMDADSYASAIRKQGNIAGTTCTFTSVQSGEHSFYVSTLDGSSFKTATITMNYELKAYATYKAVRLKWDEVGGATGYIVKRSESADGVYEERAIIDNPAQLEHKDSAAADTKFYYVVCAYKDTVDNIIAETDRVSCGAVRVMKIKFTFATTRTLTSHTGGSVKHVFKKGYTTEANGFADGKYHFQYKGRTYYVTRISTKNHKISSINRTSNYSKDEAQYYVNDRGLKSSTKYLIWVNTYTQREYIFTGSKGKWKAKYSWEISTGKADTPTKVAVTKIKKKLYERHNLHYWNMCSQFSIHNKANSWKLGYPRSGGCVRNTTDHAKWIYNNCPLGTAVCIF